MKILLRSYTLTAFVVVIANSITAQPAPKPFTRQDTLRGTLSAARSWWDVVFYDLHVTPDFERFSISGSNTVLFRIVRNPAAVLQIDLQEPLVLDSAFLNNVPIKYKREGNAWFLELPRRKMPPSLPQHQYGGKPLQELRLYYHGVPRPAIRAPWDGGLVWKKDAAGNPWLGTACQGFGASSWWPCKDHQSDEPDSARINVTVADTLMNISNGRLKDVRSAGNGKRTYIWQVSYPINSYNLTMNVGKYAHFSDTLMGENGKLDLDFYVLNYNLEKAKQQFTQVKPMLRAFEYWMGPYPFYRDGYKLVETHYLGMEHQSAIAYGNQYKNGYLGNDLSRSGWGLKWDFIIVHESGHEWFGNNITTKDIADMWVHEGFTNYSEVLYTDYHFGTAAGDAYLQGLRSNIANDQPIIGAYGVNRQGSSDMYYKGSNLVHMIRQIAGDSLFRLLLRDMHTRFGIKTTTSAEVEAFISQRIGYDLSKTFDQYLRTTQIPVLEYFVSDSGDDMRLHYRWSNCIAGFNMPVLLPGAPEKYGLLMATENWQQLRVQFATPQELSANLNKNFYVTYKLVNP